MPAYQSALSAGRSTQKRHDISRRRIRLQPEYYIKRDTGELVPLVPADELPLEFYGLPRSLSSVENPRMIFLGQKGPWIGYYQIKQPRVSVHPEQPNAQSNTLGNAQTPKATRELSTDSTSSRPTPEPVAFKATAATLSDEATSQVKPRQPTLLDTRHELCHNWIRGHCKFESNCHRLHQMPETTEEWQDIILRGILNRGGDSKGVTGRQNKNVARHNKPQSDLDILNREIVFLRRELANQSHMRKGRHQRPPRAGVPEIEARLTGKVLDDKDTKRDLDREAELEKEQGKKDATTLGKASKEPNGSQTMRSQPIASATEGVRTGNLVDVK